MREPHLPLKIQPGGSLFDQTSNVDSVEMSDSVVNEVKYRKQLVSTKN